MIKEYLKIVKDIALVLLKAAIASIPYCVGAFYSMYTDNVVWQLIGLGISLFVLTPIWCLMEKE